MKTRFSFIEFTTILNITLFFVILFLDAFF